MNRTANVQDRPAENGIKMINIIASLTFLMTGGIGTWIATSIDKMNDKMQKFAETMVEVKGDISKVRDESNRIKEDVKNMSNKVEKNSERIYSLEGKVQWRK